jgi:hypothetical protein
MTEKEDITNYNKWLKIILIFCPSFYDTIQEKDRIIITKRFRGNYYFWKKCSWEDFK